MQRLSVYEASKRLKISESAVRQRAYRGTLESEKDESGRLYVYITEQDTQDNGGTPFATELVEELRDRIRFLEEQLQRRENEAERRDVLLAQLNQTLNTFSQRVPELEAPSEATESPTPNSLEDGKKLPAGETQTPW